MTKKKMTKLIKKFNSNGDDGDKIKKVIKKKNKVRNLINKFEEKISIITENTSEWEKEKKKVTIKKRNDKSQELEKGSESECDTDSELARLEEEFKKISNKSII
jgi:hypothetical protein